MSAIRKFLRRIVSPHRPMKDEVWLQIVSDTQTGAILSSDYAQCRVNEKKFRRLGPGAAAMLFADARLCGLDDGWT